MYFVTKAVMKKALLNDQKKFVIKTSTLRVLTVTDSLFQMEIS